MYPWIYAKSTGEWLSGGPCEPRYDPATQGVCVLVRHPDPRLERYDGATSSRPATTQEISEYDAAQLTAIALGRFDHEKLVKAVAIYFAQKMAIPLATAKSDILTIYRGL